MSASNGRKAFQDDCVFHFDDTSVVAIPVRNGPISDLGISPDGRRLVVVNPGRDMVSVVDTDARQVVQTLGGLDEPFAVALSGGDAPLAYISTATSSYDSVGVVDFSANALIARHPLAHSVSDLTVSADGRFIYAGRNRARGADVAVVDTLGGETEVIELAAAAGTTADCVRLSPDGSQLYVATNGPSGGQLVVVEAGPPSDGGSRIVGIYELGLPIRDVALSGDGGIAYVASSGPVVGAVLDVIDTRSREITATRKLSELSEPITRLALSRDGRRAYLVSDGHVAVVCTGTHDVVGDITVAEHPSCVVESPDGRYLYIGGHSGVVTVVPIAAGGGSQEASTTRVPAAVPREPVLA
ncbi:YVTN family beta-propeller repeat protein [Mycobacterium europaeum]|uniref:YVTN family beta-propeller repeat protein n=1 Tax=Mycobacterium europaeum TaxID=761804 RepID=A0A0U1CUM7_9MYCO|nr:YncE family protein [Mycobacterium europaeum]CQD02223.1 YVTN family beta-propeller repeat protein [Mycobacterium europaeum]